MNIEDFKPITCSLDDIFRLQREIKFRYEPEASVIFEQFDIDTYEDQETFKKYCWRITEELMEALEDSQNKNHFKEELIDGFNFLIELYLLYGWDLNHLDQNVQLVWVESIEERIQKVVYQLGITANCLKNRQWRRSQHLVDLLIFEDRLRKVWDAYVNIFFALGMDYSEIEELWSLKYQVNLFRLNSNY